MVAGVVAVITVVGTAVDAGFTIFKTVVVLGFVVVVNTVLGTAVDAGTVVDVVTDSVVGDIVGDVETDDETDDVIVVVVVKVKNDVVEIVNLSSSPLK